MPEVKFNLTLSTKERQDLRKALQQYLASGVFDSSIKSKEHQDNVKDILEVL